MLDLTSRESGCYHEWEERVWLKNFTYAKEVVKLKQHKFWAWASVFCFLMVFYTGYKHK